MTYQNVAAPIPQVLVGKAAPDFTSAAVMPDGQIVEDFNLKSYLGGNYGVLFFWPLDFTFVCPSEIIAFDHRLKDFEALGARVIGVSVDSQFTHLAWKNTPQDKGGLGNVQFPMVADVSHAITRSYGILHDESVALRGTFLIDGAFIVRHQVVNDLPLGRNVDEAVRMVDALKFHEENGEVCPAGWNRGKPGMKATSAGVAEFLAANSGSL